MSGGPSDRRSAGLMCAGLEDLRYARWPVPSTRPQRCPAGEHWRSVPSTPGPKAAPGIPILQNGYTRSMAAREELQAVIEPDPVIEAFKKDIDRTLFNRTLRLTVEERLRDLMRMHELFDELRRAAR